MTALTQWSLPSKTAYSAAPSSLRLSFKRRSDLPSLRWRDPLQSVQVVCVGFSASWKLASGRCQLDSLQMAAQLRRRTSRLDLPPPFRHRFSTAVFDADSASPRPATA
jgi:hypothetical protein